LFRPGSDGRRYCYGMKVCTYSPAEGGNKAVSSRTLGGDVGTAKRVWLATIVNARVKLIGQEILEALRISR